MAKSKRRYSKRSSSSVYDPNPTINTAVNAVVGVAVTSAVLKGLSGMVK